MSWHIALEVTIPGEPVPKARARTVRLRNGASTTYTPRKTATYENWVRQCALEAMARLPQGRFPLDEPLMLDATFAMPRPKKPKFRDHPATKPDRSNLLKAVEDGLQLAGVFVDDSRIVGGKDQKVWAGGQPGARVFVLRWTR